MVVTHLAGISHQPEVLPRLHSVARRRTPLTSPTAWVQFQTHYSLKHSQTMQCSEMEAAASSAGPSRESSVLVTHNAIYLSYAAVGILAQYDDIY